MNRAGDDAASLAVSSKLNSDSRMLNRAVLNISDDISFLVVAEGALNELSLITQRQSELAEQAANGVLSLTQRQALNQRS
jgi:flagellin